MSISDERATSKDPTGYGWRTSTPPLSHSYLNHAILKILQSQNACRVLDFGCGNGALCRFLSSFDFHVVGVEPDLAGVQIARRESPSIAFYQLGVEDNPDEIVQSEGLFDVVVSAEVVEHLYSPHLLSHFAWRCLKPGGLFVVTTPYHGYLKNLFLSLAGKWDHHHHPLRTGGHIKFWSRSTLSKLLVDQGFVLEDFIGVGRFPWVWKSMILLSRKPSTS